MAMVTTDTVIMDMDMDMDIITVATTMADIIHTPIRMAVRITRFTATDRPTRTTTE